MTNSNYKIIEIDGNDTARKQAFHEFISVVFPGLNFREWEQNGFWTERYHPHSIIESGKINSKVSVSLMDIYLQGRMIKAAQIGAVGALPEYRNQGLSRKLNFLGGF